MIPNIVRDETEVILQHWNNFVDTFLINKKSYLKDSPSRLLSEERINKVLELFYDDQSDRDFEAKLADQYSFDKATDEDRLLFIHAEWIYLLFPRYKQDTKVKRLNRWESIDIKYVVEGVAKTGIKFNGGYWQIRFILELFKESMDPKNKNSDWIEDYCIAHENDGNVYDICSVIKYLVKPDYYEQIISKNAKQTIYEHYQYLLSEPTESIDEGIFLIRKQMTINGEQEGFHFYREPYLSQWQTKENFKNWLQGQTSQQGRGIDVRLIVRYLDKFHSENKTEVPIFAITDIGVIQGLHTKCGRGNELGDWNYSTINGQGGPSRGLHWYLQFLKRETITNSIGVSESSPEYNNDNKTKYPLNQILYGSAGTGKTYRTTELALEVLGGSTDGIKNIKELKEKYPEQVEFVTFHQNFAYEDFIEGIKPVMDEGTTKLKYEIQDGIFKSLADKARNNIELNYIELNYIELNYVLIIDEINRGNIAKIFGELITLIEPSKREGEKDAISVTLPYSQDDFSVPNNLYIIGTMNTSDRSIALLDTALRRRFQFIEMMPNAKHKSISTNVDGINCQLLLEAINNRIRVLLDREHQIGHTYFMDIKSLEGLKAVFQNQLIPLLQEYFYNDWERIDLVLNKNGFIKSSPIKEGLFKNGDLIEDDAKIYELESNEEVWNGANSYRKIYKSNKEDDSNQDT